ncbi:hypothetical protein BJV78DRAFT_1239495 [Lactifluus subvellereus]|nr:hypothetical protein BJV78DRAFT_1239495 [Lactifluus subvellereus]
MVVLGVQSDDRGVSPECSSTGDTRVGGGCTDSVEGGGGFCKIGLAPGALPGGRSPLVDWE